MTFTLPPGQKFRFKGRDSLKRASILAAQIGAEACVRRGSEIELTCEHDFSLTPRKDQTVLRSILAAGRFP